MRGESEFPSWIHVRRVIQTEVNGWRVEIDPLSPRRLMSFSRVNHDARFSALGLEPQPTHEFQPEEIYVRDHDLIVRYSQSEGDLCALQLDWRLKPSNQPFFLDLEIWISIQTRLLDTHPTVAFHALGPAAWNHLTHSELSGQWSSDSQALVGGVAVWRSDSDDACLVWMVDPGDQSEFTWEPNSTARDLRAILFGRFLEKGVIRRARCRALIGSPELNLDDLKYAYKDLSTSCLPLTA